MRSSDSPVGGIEASTEGQIQRLLAALRDVLGGDILGVYLYGSAVQGGLRPRSDIDIMVVTTRRTSLSQKRRLIDHLLALSGEGGSGGPPWPVELVIVVQAEIRPWRYPPAFDFMYGEWLRHEFECGELQPWPSTTSPDLAVLVAMVLLGDAALLGPPATQVFDPMPRGDLLRATVSGIDSLLDDLDSDTRNVVLTLARIWCSVGTGTIRSKDGAADWVLGRLPREHRVVLVRARAIYLGEEAERWEDVRPQVHAYAAYVASEARRAAPRLARRHPRGAAIVATPAASPLSCKVEVAVREKSAGPGVCRSNWREHSPRWSMDDIVAKGEDRSGHDDRDLRTPRQVVMFDFDGVIADTRDRFCEMASAAFLEVGRPDLADREQVLALLDGNWFASLVSAGLTEEQRRRVDEVFGSRLYEAAKPFTGAREMLLRLARRHTLVVITSSRTASIEAFVTAHGLPGISEVIGSDVETSKVRKMARVLGRYGPEPHYWYVGDTAGDILEGKQAGVTTVGVAWGYHGAERLRRVAPDYIVGTPAQLAEVVELDGMPRRDE